jgi:stage V sporulation protein AC
MNMDPKAYSEVVKSHAPKSPMAKDCFHAFWVGGLICTIGQGLTALYTSVFGLDKDNAGTLCAATLILLAAILTGAGLFDRIAKYAGAGTLLPITGFANAVVSPAIDSRAEGLVLGVGAKIFTVAGPVLLYGTLAGTLWGIVYYIMSLF